MFNRPLRPAFLALLAVAFSGTARAQSAPVPTNGNGIPTPQSSLGFKPGDDFKLASYDESIAYFKKLDAASDKLQLVEIGKTSGGLPWYIALISSAENLRNVERHREIAQRLSLIHI